MIYSLRFLVIALLFCFVNGSNDCDITVERREVCGYIGISENFCKNRGCCYDNERNKCYRSKNTNVIAPYPGSERRMIGLEGLMKEGTYSPKRPNADVLTGGNSNMISLLTILQMKKDKVSQNIINALIADSIPNGELFYYLADEDTDATTKLLQLQGSKNLELDTLQILLLQNGDIKSFLYKQIGESYGLDPLIIKLLMAGESAIVKEHFLAKFATTLPSDPMTRLVVRSIIDNKQLTTKTITDSIIDSMLSTNFDPLTTAAFKAMLSGNTNTAKNLLIAAQLSKQFSGKPSYPQNEALFARFVETNKQNPNKISPAMIMSLAKNEKIPALAPDKSFTELFGVSAFDYVCAVHTADLQIGCRALSNKPYASSLECFNAGCCLKDNPAGGKPICYENILGTIGVGFAANIWDESYIVNTIFGGDLPELSSFYPDGIPWIISRGLPAVATIDDRLKGSNQANWWNALNPYGRFRVPIPTGPPVVSRGSFNPGFKWVPHGVTPNPYPTNGPDIASGIALATSSPGALGVVLPEPAAASSSIVKDLITNTFPGCFTTPLEDRVACMGNDVAWLPDGEAKCASIGCCYVKIISDTSIPACFSSRSRGQCHNVAPGERINCGQPGISADECLSNPQCCYDSTSNFDSGLTGTPWCYYKKYTFLPDNVLCSSVGTKEGCFPVKQGGIDVNKLVSQESCEKAGCCYEKTTASLLDRALGLASIPPFCFKKRGIDIQKPEPLPPTAAPPATTSVCQFRDVLPPTSRVPCPARDYFECVKIKECCYQVELYVQAPFCFQKSEV